ncbi:UDP-N-acetylmuramoyl-L-alanyl-D-glutamate--2,6-diaminopimelate ligase [Kaistia dalseonensis]|uniref:UDP-N-acetylmuramoyl-L-alanyl-D-glutamate--2,6-diaminopimelate ligase n=1 Tax=Kaistia dalseonensis TaxID=410840 RepID=A0ABU0HBU1_9HYPH|nr:UDP-N-acetylmuramoyl-L-alanyl-D-glutamate--2,6-diaminopimelate ligase [Kaistia dalseonensis]MCX5497146.1 UDP-N-acetylmuramoyl-L-alanyl-D-glutamate--2,6-diaminopimelate ligase [Kaistia dalseonensis]MDQ0439773.1 UDP-N-acetylmuramoyl-L-alanyl-D-glutamate--2,6-diaminopimelate ligase [Kaistia dalseonensis]
MRLGDLASTLFPITPTAAAVEITGISADSRAIVPGTLFAALKGVAADGARFAPDAVKRGAAAVLCGLDSLVPDDIGVPVLRAADPRIALSLLAARFYPLQPEHIVAITGTSGKTSVAAFVRQIFEAAGHQAASVGTIGVVSPAGSNYGSLTTPDPVQLHQILDRLAREGVTHAAIEASSHGLDQHRLDGVRISAAGFTNLGRDHMDYHPTVEDYFAAKMRLFGDLLPEGAPAVVDADGGYAEAVMATIARRGQRLIDVGAKGRAIKLVSATPDRFSQSLDLIVFGQSMRVELPLLGDFQVSNALVAAGLAIGAGVAPETAIAALGRLVGAPGRLELVGTTAKGAMVFIDYAHKPDALDHALAALRPVTKGRLIALFGAGGDRDAGKRPLMGEAAARHADLVIVTDDNPRSEDPAAIRKAVMAGAPDAIEIGDRGRAISEAIGMLEAGDVLCVAGKGHETGQIIAGVVHHFSDHEVVAAALATEVAA